jgi:endopeptidase Clp ATP-binding regulatory subunit ClpX
MAAGRKCCGHSLFQMSHEHQGDQGGSLEQQVRDLLRRANIPFVVGGVRPNEDGAAPTTESAPSADRLKKIREFNLKPREIRDYLNRFVVRQEDAKKVLSVAICDHYNHVRRCIADSRYGQTERAKHNIVLLGPTGVGKTYLLRCAARLIGVPFVKADATKFSETGYVGHDVEDLVRDLVKAANGDVDVAQYGMVFLDEVDKIASQPTAGGRDVSGRGVQTNLLKLMEETDVSLFSQTDLLGQIQAVMDMQRGKEPGPRTINTRHILFIVSGAFDKLADLVRQRVKTSRIGFAHEAIGEGGDTECLRLAQTSDFIAAGFEPEFIGRLPVRVVCDPLGTEDLEAIMLHSEENILDQYRADFEGYGIHVLIRPEAIARIARLAVAEKTGARGLMTVLERVFRDFKFELPSSAVRSLEVTAETVEKPEAALGALLQDRTAARTQALRVEVQKVVEEFKSSSGLALDIVKEGVDAIVEICLRENKSVAWLWKERFADLEYGFKLIARNTGRSSFRITRKFVENPSEELSRRVARSFQAGSEE